MAGSVEYSVVDFKESLQASFIGGGKEPDDRYAPRILSNDEGNSSNVLSVIKSELLDCVSFSFSIAFITSSGIQVLAKILQELRQRGIPGRILTSTYLNFNDPDALRKLLEYPNIEARVYQGDLHAKGYFFDKDGISTIIIGSSNLTQRALTCSKEWNVLFRTFPEGGILQKTKSEFDKLWQDKSSVRVTEEWIQRYEAFLQVHKPEVSVKHAPAFSVEEDARGACADLGKTRIKPNKMQEAALEALEVLHKRNEPRALLISATGTGKTYLSALDVLRIRPGRVLSIAHRQRILDASQRSYQRVLGDSYSYGQFSDPAQRSASCLFGMVIQLSNYFKPKFVLGMTATPARTDGYDVYGLFNHVIAYRITLQDALENDMLVPFHYFGIADLAIGDETVDDVSLFGKLASAERADHVIQKIEEYSVRKNDRKGLVFCSRNDEAREMSRLFNERGYRTVAISGETSDGQRNESIARLESGELQYIFSVDILNEGVDIPSLNEIIMLRRTESAIVFVQQLGRGLRKDPSKDYTLVLDFIGNYQQNYLIPMALAGDRSYNKDNLRKVVKEGSSAIPGCSTISFDRVSEQRIFKSLEEGRFGSAQLIRGEYDDLRRLLGRIPSLLDFDESESIDPLLIIGKYGSYPAFLQKYDKECPFTFSEGKLAYLKFASEKLAAGKRLADLEALNSLIDAFAAGKTTGTSLPSNALDARSVVRTLTGAYSTKGRQLLVVEDGVVRLSDGFAAALADGDFLKCVVDLIKFGFHRNAMNYRETYKDTNFVLNQKYTREEVCRLLRWEKEPNYQNVGGYYFDKDTKTFPVFVNYEKDPSISITTQYHDRFVSDRSIICISKSKRTLESPEIERLARADELGMRCFLYLRKNKNDKDNGTEFYFLGEMHPTGDFEQIVMADGKTNAVEILYDLEEPVRPDLYDYFLSSFDE